jgi:rod shape-determining protein MreC
VVSIFTYRDERKLLAVIGTVIVAAVIALVQLDALRTGKASPIAAAVTSTAFVVQSVVAGVAGGIRGTFGAIGDAPRLYVNNKSLTSENRSLRAENARLREALGAAPAASAIAKLAAATPHGVAANVIGYDPENISRVVTVDRGLDAGLRRDDGVIGDEGVVGRVISAGPLSSSVLLVTDAASKVPAIVARGRWWGIATGTNARIAMQYISQDAKLKKGDYVVTGNGRSFRAGLPLGRIIRVDHPEGALYQTAIVEPAVAFGRLTRVVVIAH